MKYGIKISPDEEKLLLAQLAEGDENALSSIYHHFALGLFNAANNILRDHFVVQDIIQEVFLSLWQNRQKLAIRTSLNTYLHSAVRYKVFHAIKRGKGTEALFDQLEERIWGPPVAENLLYQKELEARVKKIVDALPEKCQQVYKMSREQYLSHKEIADRLQITTKAVEFQITEALKRIRKSIN